MLRAHSIRYKNFMPTEGDRRSRRRIALFSKAFLPNVGGIETSSAMMATIWHRAGHDVEVVTAVPDSAPWPGPYRVTRSWNLRALGAAVDGADLVVTNGYSRLAIAVAALPEAPARRVSSGLPDDLQRRARLQKSALSRVQARGGPQARVRREPEGRPARAGTASVRHGGQDVAVRRSITSFRAGTSPGVWACRRRQSSTSRPIRW